MSERFREFELLVAPREAGARVSISGDIDLVSVPALRNGLHEALRAGLRDLDVDMSRTGFCDSAGLHALLAAQQELAAVGRAMRLINPPHCVIRLLQLTATSDRFEFVIDAPPPRELGTD